MTEREKMFGILKAFPEEILLLLESYLTEADYRCFINTSQKEFVKIRQYSIKYNLKSEYSYLYCNDPIFRHRILSRIMDPKRQVSLQFTHSIPLTLQDLPVQVVKCSYSGHNEPLHCFTNVEEIANLPGRNIQEFPYLPQLKILDAWYLDKLTDVHHLAHLHKVTLQNCPKLIDITSLHKVPDIDITEGSLIHDFSCIGRYQKRLSLAGCPLLTRVENFSTIKEIVFDLCENLEDIRPLKGVYSLKLSRCRCVKDISGLGNHYELSIERCDFHLIGYNILETVSRVALESCDINDLTVVSRASTVRFKHCPNIADVTPLANVKTVSLDNCINITDISPLRHAKNLLLGDLSNLTTVHLDGYHEGVSLWKAKALPHYDLIKRAKYLTFFDFAPLPDLIEYSFSSSSPSIFSNVFFFSMMDCSTILTANGLGNIPKLVIFNCLNLHDISALGRNRVVRIYSCSGIRDVSSLRTVPMVFISRCANVEDYDCLKDVPRLSIIVFKVSKYL